MLTSTSRTTIRTTIQIHLCMIILQWVYGITEQSFQFVIATSDLNGYVCTGNDVLETATAQSFLHCGQICARDPGCQGFFHHHGDETCITSNNHFVQSNGLTAYPGMTYYQGPLWADWGGWSDCSATCGTGSAIRTRTCHPDSPLSCNGPTGDTGLCNTYSCFPRAKTCADWASKGLSQSASVQIDPLESGSDVTVNCDFDTEPGKAITIMNHDREARTYVSGFEERGAYSISLIYSIGLPQATAIVDLSTECKQFLQLECSGVALSPYTFWRTRNGSEASYFNGSPPPGKYCACGDSGTCSSSAVVCNCDINDSTLRSDAGYVTRKNHLPIYGLGIGDTGYSTEYGYHTVGPLLCS